MIKSFCDINECVSFMKTKSKINKKKLIVLVFMLTLLNIASIYTQKTEAIDTHEIISTIEVEHINDISQYEDDDLISNLKSLPGKEYIEYNQSDFITNPTTCEYIDTTIVFNDNVYWNFPDTIFKYKYSNLNGFKASIPIEMYKFLEKQKQVKYIYENVKNNVTVFTNDLLTWGIDRIDAEDVWGDGENAVDVVEGNPTGDEVKVCIIDTGIDYYHTDLNANYKGGYDFAPINGSDNYDNDPYPDHTWGDYYMHGTRVAGLLAAEDNEEDIIGVAPEVSLYVVKMLGITWDYGSNEYVEYVADFDLGIDWAINNSMDIINISMGGTGYVQAVEEACQKAYEKGITIIAATADNYDNERYYPCSYSSVIQIGATNSFDIYTVYTSYGEYQEFVAPGGGILDPLTTTDFDGGTVSERGTSFASPIVAGTCALLHDVAPNIMPEEIRYILRITSIDKGDSGWDQYYGWGLIQAESAVVALTDGTDSDSDGLINIIETNVWGTDPYDSDSDNDGLNDTAEVRIYHSDPLLVDTDRDSLSDYDEVTDYLTDPINEDSDNDGYHDQIEVLLDYDPLDNTQHPPQSFFLEYGDGEDYTWSASQSSYNAVTENDTYEGEYYFVSDIEEISRLGYDMFAETTALDLDDWDGTSDLKLTFRFRCRSNYSSSSVTQFRLKFYDDDTSSYLEYDNPTAYSYYYVGQSVRNGQDWIDGKDSGWQNESFTLLASEFEDFAETNDALFIEWGFHDSWSTNWDQTVYLDYLLISEDDNTIVPNQPRDLFGIGDEVSSIALTWKSPTNILAEEYIIERKVGDEYIEQETVDHDGTINTVQYWPDPDTLSTGVTYYYRVCAVQNDIEGAYAYWNGEVDGFGMSNPIDLVASIDINSTSQNGYVLLIVLSIISLLGIGQSFIRFRQSLLT